MTHRSQFYRILAPAHAGNLRTGTDAGSRAPGRRTLSSLLELVPIALAVFDSLGRPVLANTSFRQILDDLPESSPVHRELAAAARSLATTSGVDTDDPSVIDLSFSIADRHFRVRGRSVAANSPLLPVSGALLVLQPMEPDPLSDAILRRRFLLTRTESRVARLLAEGRSNAGIAAELCISPHTARHHTERVLAKLGIRSRAAVGPMLRRPSPSGRRLDDRMDQA